MFTTYQTLKKTTIFNIGKIFRMFGYDVVQVRRQAADDSLPYGPVHPHASYSPWVADQAFENAYQDSNPFTMVDRYRCFELWELTAQATKRDGAFIEIGVWRGGTGLLIAERLRQLGELRPVYLCDTYEGIVKAGSNDPTIRDGMYADTSAEAVAQRARERDLDHIKVLKGIFPDDTADRIVEDQIAFAHVDVDAYNSARDVLEWLWPRLVPGGVVVFDDYGFKGARGIASYVDENKARSDLLFIHNLNGHAVWIKQTG